MVWAAVESGQTQDDDFPLPGNRVLRMIAVPVLGPSGHVHATAIWAGDAGAQVPTMPTVGAMEWSVAGTVIASPAANNLLRPPHCDLLAGNTIAEMIAGVDYWDDRSNFLALFNLAGPADSWIGTVTRTFDDNTQHHLNIAARAVGAGADRVVRAIVCDVTGHQMPTHPDPCSIPAEYIPIPPGHALALVDLKSGFVHTWPAEPCSPMERWRLYNPEFDPDGQMLVATTSFELGDGIRRAATLQGRIRFSPNEDWIELETHWTRVSDGERPQTLIDVMPLLAPAATAAQGGQLR